MNNDDVKSGDHSEGDGQGNGAARDAGGEPAPVATIEERMARLEQDKGELHDRLLRVAADAENYKKRVRRDIDDAVHRARESLLSEVLAVMDNLERATAAVHKGGSLESLAQGVKLVEKQMAASLERQQVKSFEAVGEPFDPARHEAIQQVETTEHPPGTVAQVFARGYFLGERLLRPAMVAVAKAPAGATAARASEDGDDRDDGDDDAGSEQTH